MSELKPCPFCGKTATLDYSVLPNGKHWFITCDRCGMMYQDVISQRKYVKDGWNTRPIEDALTARIAELEAENIRLGIEYQRMRLALGDIAINSKRALNESPIDQLTAHSDIERQDDKSSNDTQTQTIVYHKENKVSHK